MFQVKDTVVHLCDLHPKGRVRGIYPKRKLQFFVIQIQSALVQGAGQAAHVHLMEVWGLGQLEPEGKAKDQIVQHRDLCQSFLWGLLEEDAAPLPLHPVAQCPVLVATNFQGCKGDLQWGRGTLVEEVGDGG